MVGLRVTLDLLKNRELRRVMGALVAFALTEHGSWLALMVFAYQRGGVREAGVVLFVMHVPSAVLAPLAAARLGRVGRGRALVWGFLAQAVLMGLTGLALHLEAHGLVVYAAALAAMASLVLTRPTVAALLPSMARSVEDLTAANVTVGLVATVGLFLGPALGGAVLAVYSIGGVFWSAALLMAGATALTARIAPQRVDLDDAAPHSEHEPPAIATSDENTDRFSPWLLMSVLSLVFFTVGAIDVAFVAAAVELIGRSEATAGALSAAFGLGALAGAAASLLLVGRRRLTPALALAATTLGFSVAALSFGTSLYAAVALLALAGAGRALADVAGRTMLQGLSAEDVLASVFGLLEGISLLALAFGGLTFALLTELLGLETALVVIGVMLPAGVVLTLTPLMAIDRRRPVVDPSLVSLLRANPVFGPLPAFAVEQVLVNLGREDFQPGESIITMGDVGHTIYFLVDGSATVTQGKGIDHELANGDYFGEIGLLFDRPRTATVTAGPTGASTLTIDRETYQQAIGTNRRSHLRIHNTARERLDRNDRAT